MDLCGCLFIIYGSDRKAEPSASPGIIISSPSCSLLRYFHLKIISNLDSIVLQSLKHGFLVFPSSFFPLEGTPGLLVVFSFLVGFVFIF